MLSRHDRQVLLVPENLGAVADLREASDDAGEHALVLDLRHVETGDLRHFVKPLATFHLADGRVLEECGDPEQLEESILQHGL